MKMLRIVCFLGEVSEVTSRQFCFEINWPPSNFGLIEKYKSYVDLIKNTYAKLGWKNWGYPAP